MDDKFDISFPILADIDPRFYNSDTNSLFTNCIECERYLLENEDYMIEKAIRKYPNSDKTITIFEYAICLECATAIRAELSEESKSALDTFFENRATMRSKSLDFMKDSEKAIDDALDSCIVTGKGTDGCEEYQIYCQCSGDKMVVSYFPFMISDLALDEVVKLLSEETKDELDGFMGKHFTGPPELKELWDRPKVVML